MTTRGSEGVHFNWHDLDSILGEVEANAVMQSRSGVLITEADIEAPGPRIVYANQAFSDITGYTPSDILGASPRLLQGPWTERSVLDQMRYCLKNEQGFLGRTWNYRKDGSPFLVEWNLAPLRLGADQDFETGRVTHFIAMQRDVTTEYALANEVVTSRELLTQAARIARIGGWQYDADTGHLQLTESTAQILEIPEASTPTLDTLLNLCPKAEQRQWFRSHIKTATTHAHTFDLTIEVQTSKQTEKWLRIAGESTPKDGAVMRITGLLHDITSHYIESQRREEAEARVTCIGDQIPGFFYQLKSEQDSGIVAVPYISSGITRFFGLPESRIRARQRGWLDWVHPDDQSTWVNDEAPGPGHAGHWHGRYRIKAEHPDSGLSDYIWVEDTASWRQTEPGHYVWDGFVMPIMERKSIEDELRWQAYYDPLTGLGNRNLLHIRLAEAIDQAAQNKNRLAVLYMDLDDFKDINDAWGHPMGDRVLKAIAQRITSCIQSVDDLARVGGDEMVLIGRDIQDSAAADTLASQVYDGLQDSVQVGDQSFDIDLSIGISLYPEDGQDANTLLSHADAALYATKYWGGQTWGYYTPELARSAAHRLTTKNRMRRALDNQEFAVAVQPIVQTPDHAIIGYEVLARWPQPNADPVSPGHFIPLAETYGLIRELGGFILEQSTQWLGSDTNAADTLISVNVSPRQLVCDDFVEMVTSRIKAAGIRSDQVVLELTEEVLMRADPEPIDRLDQLRNLGVRIAIDDFGTGYASLKYLVQLPADILKIDQAFVRNLDTDATQGAIVKTVVSLARAFDLQVLAEGIETEAEARAAADLGCDLLQGYYFGRPVIQGPDSKDDHAHNRQGESN